MHQNIHDYLEIFQKRKLRLEGLLRLYHKNWHIAALENALQKTRRLDLIYDDAKAALAQNLKESLKLANIYARHELQLQV